MFNLIQLGDVCQGIKPIVIVVKSVFKLIQFGIPILLILLGTIDLGKAVMSSDDKEVKASQSRLIKRCIYAAAIFFIVLLVNLIMGIVAKGVAEDTTSTPTDTGSWIQCWNES